LFSYHMTVRALKAIPTGGYSPKSARESVIRCSDRSQEP